MSLNRDLLEHMIDARRAALRNGDAVRALSIELDLFAEGVILQDAPGGTRWTLSPEADGLPQ